MATLSPSLLFAPARAVARLFAPWPAGPRRSYLRRLLHVAMVWQARAEERYALAEMDERMLRDIGVDRRAARQEAAKPFWRP